MENDQAQCTAMKTFLDNLAIALSAAGMKWCDLSALSGINQGNLSRIRTGREKLTIDRAEIISQALGYSLHKLTNPQFRPSKSRKSKGDSIAA